MKLKNVGIDNGLRKIVYACLMAAVVFLGAGQFGLTAESAGQPEYKTASSEGITIRWRVEDKSLRVILDSPLSGWVACGFDPSFMMKGANFIIGYVDNGKVYISDEYGTGLMSHKPDTELGGTSDVTEASGAMIDGKTEISFVIPLDSKDKYDKPLVPGKTYKVLLAAGTKRDLTSIHKIKTSVKIKL